MDRIKAATVIKSNDQRTQEKKILEEQKQ